MKNLKLSFALVIAIFAVGVTVAANANVFGKRVITRCFTQISLQNQAGSVSASLDASVAPFVDCNVAKAQVATTPYLTAANVSTSLPSEAPCDDVEIFCCAKVTEITSADPGYTNAPFLNLGEGLRKYKIASTADVFCKIRP